MVVRMAHWKCRPEFWGQEGPLFVSGSIAVMKRHKGFRHAMLLGVFNDSHRIALTVWDSEADYRAFIESPDLARIGETFSHMYGAGTSPKPHEYEVLAEG